MNTFLRNAISKLYNAVSASVTARQDALAERLQSLRDTASLLYNRMMDNMGYGQRRNDLNTSWKKKQKKSNQ